MGLIPFIELRHELAALPYMTKDFIKMKQEERRLAKSVGMKFFFTFYIYLTLLFNYVAEPVLVHLQQRGIYTAYWVLNVEEETQMIIQTSAVQGIMTDRPVSLKPFFLKKKTE